MEKFGFIDNGKYDCNGQSEIISKQSGNKQFIQRRNFDQFLFIDHEKCSKSKRCQDLIKSHTVSENQTNLIVFLKDNDCLSCINSSLL